jgi:hypothetical protein
MKRVAAGTGTNTKIDNSDRIVYKLLLILR